ncbi:MAG: hypothetical protein KF724_08065 [Phycisphaeraceae bacterium]|nr:hypothetical protein [Phycisphaeraceae bacterium]
MTGILRATLLQSLLLAAAMVLVLPVSHLVDTGRSSIATECAKSGDRDHSLIDDEPTCCGEGCTCAPGSCLCAVRAPQRGSEDPAPPTPAAPRGSRLDLPAPATTSVSSIAAIATAPLLACGACWNDAVARAGGGRAILLQSGILRT